MSYSKDNQPHEIPLADIIVPATNVRTGALPDIAGLTATIKAVGLIQPLVVRLTEKGEAELVAGFRRYFAAEKAGLEKVKVEWHELDDIKKHDMAVIENLAREDMNPIDRALGIKTIMEKHDFDQRGVANFIGKTDGYISQHLALLKLPEGVQKQLQAGKVKLSHARALCRLEGDEERIMQLLPEITENGISSTELDNRVTAMLRAEPAEKPEAQEVPPESSKEGAKKAAGSKKAPAGEAPKKKKSIIEQYEEAELNPRNKTQLRELLVTYAGKYDNAKSPEKIAEYKHILKGLELASGLAD